MKRKLSLLLAVMMIISSMTCAVFATELDMDKFDNDVDFMKKVIDVVLDGYLYEVNQEAVMEGLYDGFFNVLDKYSVYYTEKEYDSFIEHSAGEFTGIGVSIIERDGQTVILTPLPDSPALSAGLKSGDIIISVDDKNVSGMSSGEISSLIKGDEGTTVNVGVSRNGKELKFDIKRAPIVTSSVQAKILDDNIGYIKVTEFAENTTELTKKELDKFDEKNVKKIILDMRNNGGGITDTAVNMLSLFVTEGPVLYIDYADGTEKVYNSTLKEQKYEIALMINEGSASATEIFAGAVKDKKEGIIVGTQSYGKGIAQSSMKLNNNAGGIKFTVAEFFTTSKNKIHGVGITPDIIVNNPEFDYEKFYDFSDDKTAELNTVSLDVLSAEMILEYIGYDINEADGVFDQKTLDAFEKFQKDNNMTVNGKLDTNAKSGLLNALANYVIPEAKDLQLQEAVKALKNK